MVGNTTYGQVIYFDTEKKEFEIIDLDKYTYMFKFSEIELPAGSRWTDLLGKNVGVMEIDDVATKIIWQEF
jgi:hypothetical protein